MKFALALSLLFSFSALAVTKLDCQVDLLPISKFMSERPDAEDGPMVSSMRVYSVNTEIILHDGREFQEGRAAYTTENGEVAKNRVAISSRRSTVRAGLDAGSMLADDLTEAEELIIKTIGLLQLRELKGVFKAGIDLKKIRSAMVHVVREGKMEFQVIEASDKDRQVLGSFVTGPYVRPCR